MSVNKRLNLSRRLTELTNLTVEQALAEYEKLDAGKDKPRIAFTGAPGAGKSTVISHWADYRIKQGSSVAVLAIDPSSPLTGGAILGDRTRMGPVADHPDFFFRSLSSRDRTDGLCKNLEVLLAAIEVEDYDHVVLETVGIGQVSYDVKSLVDCMVLVLSPDSGDAVQAMKSGIMEMADIFVVSKADLPAAVKFIADLRSTLGLRQTEQVPAVLGVSSFEKSGLEELDQEISRCLHEVRLSDERQSQNRVNRMRYQLKSMLTDLVDEVLQDYVGPVEAVELSEIRLSIIERLTELNT